MDNPNNAYTLVSSSSSPFDTTFSAENATDSQFTYTVHSTHTMASRLVSQGREVGKIEHFPGPLGSDNVLIGEKNIKPSGLKTMGIGRSVSPLELKKRNTNKPNRHGAKVFEGSDGVQYSWKLVQGEGWTVSALHSISFTSSALKKVR